ncbi:hypothetical protein AN643_04065, partial [Candidatus Epulonipiscioides saccharophilum]
HQNYQSYINVTQKFDSEDITKYTPTSISTDLDDVYIDDWSVYGLDNFEKSNESTDEPAIEESEWLEHNNEYEEEFEPELIDLDFTDPDLAQEEYIEEESLVTKIEAFESGDDYIEEEIDLDLWDTFENDLDNAFENNLENDLDNNFENEDEFEYDLDNDFENEDEFEYDLDNDFDFEVVNFDKEEIRHNFGDNNHFILGGYDIPQE